MSRNISTLVIDEETCIFMLPQEVDLDCNLK